MPSKKIIEKFLFYLEHPRRKRGGGEGEIAANLFEGRTLERLEGSRRKGLAKIQDPIFRARSAIKIFILRLAAALENRIVVGKSEIAGWAFQQRRFQGRTSDCFQGVLFTEVI